jgi:hypothetical protein
LILESVNRSLKKRQLHGGRNLPCKRIQVDEIWAFVYAKQKNVATAKACQYGRRVDLDRYRC